MNIDEFKIRLKKATLNLIKFIQPQISNQLNKEIFYIVEPSDKKISTHLNEIELVQLGELNKVENRLMTSEEVSKILFIKNLVPIWINMEVHQSYKKKTVVKLICSRRYKEVSKINSQIDKFPPFHILLSLPPWHKDKLKFDINWKHQKFKFIWHKFLFKCKN